MSNQNPNIYDVNTLPQDEVFVDEEPPPLPILERQNAIINEYTIILTIPNFDANYRHFRICDRHYIYTISHKRQQ